MKRNCFLVGVVLTAVLFPWPGFAGRKEESKASRKVLVRVSDADIVSPSLYGPALGIAEKVLKQADVQLRWARLSKVEPTEPMNDCRERDLRVIDLRFVRKAPVSERRGTIAVSSPFTSRGLRITIYWDRLLEQYPTRDEGALRPVLGHVLAHEIGHILLGTMHHTTSGLMKASFTGEERSLLQVKPLKMEQVDIDTIQRNLDAPLGVCQTVSLDGPNGDKVQ